MYDKVMKIWFNYKEIPKNKIKKTLKKINKLNS